MFNGLEHVWRAAEILVDHDFKLRERLCSALSEFSVALLQPEQWPPELYEKARSYRKRLTVEGNFEVTIGGMQTADVSRAAIDLLDLAFDIRLAQVDHFKQQRPNNIWQRIAAACRREISRKREEKNTD
jgi:hypothetical protein